MADKEFKTPQDALAHYGKKGMKWGVRNEEKSKGGGGRPKEDSKDELERALDSVFTKEDPSVLQAEGQKKLKAQAEQSFPTKAALKADRLEGKAAEYDKVAKRNEELRDEITGNNLWNKYERKLYNDQIKTNEKYRDDLLKKADQVREGKLTDKQKLLIGLGTAAAVTGLAIYGQRQYTLHQAGVSSRDKKRAAREALLKNTEEWNALFGEDPGFKPAGSHLTAGGGPFYSGLTNKKAMDRPEFVIPKSTVFQRLSNHEEDSSEYGRAKGAYATFLHNDKKLYGASGEFGAKKFTVNFQAKDDVRVPALSTVLAHLTQISKQDNPLSPNNNPEGIMLQYRSMVGGNWADTRSQKLFASLRQYGYSAIVDDMDAGYLGDLPVVFFGDAAPATVVPRTKRDQVRDSVGVLKTSGKYA